MSTSRPGQALSVAKSKQNVSTLSSFLHNNLLLLLIGLRLLNALTLRTFFQPDEYYQALEPAWWLAFGKDSGAWLTWVSSTRLKRHEYTLTHQ